MTAKKSEDAVHKSRIKRNYKPEKKPTDFAFGDIERKCLIVHPQLNTNPNVTAATITAIFITGC